MASKFSIEAIFKGNDQLSKVMRKISGEGSSFSRRFGADMAKAERSMMKMGEKFKSGVGNVISNTASTIGNTVKYGTIAAGAGLIYLAKEGLRLASDLNEVQNVVDKTFGENSKQINDFAKTSLMSFGVTELEAKKFTGSLGAMLKSSGVANDKLVEMSTGIAGLSGDFASFYNLGVDEAFEKLRSGIAGETEPLKALGINMSVANLEAYALTQGITKSWKAMSQAEQVSLRYNYLMKVSKDAQGDFAKTSKQAANQERLATAMIKQKSAAIMSRLLPAYTKLLTGFNSMMQNIDTEAIGKKLEEFANKGIEKLKQIKQWFIDNKQTIDEWFTAIKITFQFLLDRVKDAIKIFEKLKPVIFSIIGAWALYKIAVYGVIVAQTIMSGLIAIGKFLQFIKIIYMTAKAKGVWAAAQKALNLAMSINPIGLIILGVTLLIAIIGTLVVIIVKNWDTIKAVTMQLVNGIVKWFSDMWTMISTGISNFISSAITWFSDMWLTLQSVFTMAGEIISNIMSAVWNGIKTGFEFVFNFIKSYLFTIADTILSTFGNIIKSVMKAVSFVGKSLGIDTSGLEKAIATIDGLQTKVRENSLFSEQGRAKAISGGRDTTKSTRSETVTTNELIVKNESNNRVEFGGKQIGRDFQRLMPSTSR